MIGLTGTGPSALPERPIRSGAIGPGRSDELPPSHRGAADSIEALPVRCGGGETTCPVGGLRRGSLTRSFRASASGRGTATGPAEPYDPGLGPALQRREAAARPLRPVVRAARSAFGPEVLGYAADNPDAPSTLDSAGHMPRSIVVDDAYRVGWTSGPAAGTPTRSSTRCTSRASPCAIPEVPARVARHLRRASGTRPPSATCRPRRDRGRAAAGAPERAGELPGRSAG